MIASKAHLDPRFKAFPNLPRTTTNRSSPCRSSRGRRSREPSTCAPASRGRSREGEIELLVTIASQVAQSIEHAKLYAQAQRRVHELEALARISEAVSESLYLEESLEAIVQTTVESTSATGAAIVLEDGRIAWPEGRAGAHAVRLPLALAGRTIGELVVDRDTPFSGRRPPAARSDREPGGRGARARSDGAARRARPGDPPSRQEQPADRRVAATAPGPRRERRPSARPSATPSTASWRSQPCTRC